MLCIITGFHCRVHPGTGTDSLTGSLITKFHEVQRLQQRASSCILSAGSDTGSAPNPAVTSWRRRFRVEVDTDACCGPHRRSGATGNGVRCTAAAANAASTTPPLRRRNAESILNFPELLLLQLVTELPFQRLSTRDEAIHAPGLSNHTYLTTRTSRANRAPRAPRQYATSTAKYGMTRC